MRRRGRSRTSAPCRWPSPACSDVLTDGAPVLLAVDDAQWLDESSAAILAYAIRRLGEAPLAVLVSVRTGSGDAHASPLLAALTPDRTERVRVGAMPLASLHRLFQLRLGRSFPRLALVRIEAESRGNPLYALEIARALREAGIQLDPHAPLPIPDSLSALMATRVSALPARTQRILLLAAAAAEPSLETLERAMPDADDALRPAVLAGVAMVDRGIVRFSHPLLAQAVIGSTAPDELRHVHGILAGVATSPDARARHLGHAADGPDEAVARALADAADAARTRGATVDAAALYLDAAHATPMEWSDRRLERARLAAECLFIDLSEIVGADGILEAALREAPPGPTRAEALSLRAILRYYHGRVPEAVAMGEQALAEAGPDTMLRAKVLGRVAFLVMQVDLERGHALIAEAAALLEGDRRPADPDLVANVLLLRGNAELMLVEPTRRAEIDRGLRLISADGRSWEHEGADGCAFGLARLTDDLDHAIEMTRELIRVKSGPGGDDPFNLVQLSGLLVYQGSWSEARDVAEAALEAYAREGEDLHPAWGLRGVGLIAAHQGRLDDARRYAQEGLRFAMERGDVVISAFHRHLLGFVALSLGEWPEADRQLSAAAELATAINVRHPGRFKLAGDQVEAALALGDIQRAAVIEARLDEAARIAPTPWVLAVGARSTGSLAAARGDFAAAAAAFDRALLEHEDLPMPFERARTLLAKGRLHRRRKEKRLADETLRAALAEFEALGAAVWEEQTRAELARVGRRPHAPDELTETERRVAELAAAGLTSRQIAEQAFVAPKTVGNTLGRVYQKLGIHSRAELGALVSSGRMTGGPTPRD